MRRYIFVILILSACATTRQIYLLTDTHQVSLGQGGDSFAGFVMKACPPLGTPYRARLILDVKMDAFTWGCETRGTDHAAEVEIEAARQGWQFYDRPEDWALLSTGKIDRDTAIYYFGIFVSQKCQDTVGKITAISATAENGAYTATCTALDVGTRGTIADKRTLGEQIEILGEVPR